MTGTTADLVGQVHSGNPTTTELQEREATILSIVADSLEAAARDLCSGIGKFNA